MSIKIERTINDVRSGAVDNMIKTSVHTPSSASIEEETMLPSFDMMDAETFQNLLFPLLSCGVCRNILVDPVTLQCGNTLCRTCLPGSIEINDDPCDTITEEGDVSQLQPRSTRSYLWTLGTALHPDYSRGKWIPPTMRERFECPFHCHRKHHSRDVSSNFILQKSLDSMPFLQSCPPIYSAKPVSAPSPAEIASEIHAELDCQICYLLLHDPITTPCGHTFCRPCLLRTSDHATHPVCPTCRSPILLPTPQNTPTNILINNLIHTLFPDAAADRAACETSEQHGVSSSGICTPIFICTLALPSVTCFLHIFEPRYRLMLRRCMAGDRKFGMVLPRSCTRYLEEIQEMVYTPPLEGGELPTGSNAIFMQRGTMLEIREMQMLPDGRSLVETVGRERFSIQEWSVRDGYVVARTKTLPDLEPSIYIPPPITEGLTTSVLVNTSPDSLSTNELIYLTRCFVQSLRNFASLSPRMTNNEIDDQLSRLDSGGDAVRFAWWVGSKMPLENVELYSLLLQGGVHELYCVLGQWIGGMERQSWYVSIV
jgi:hypothetical protein